MTAGSCFASNLLPWLKSSGISFVKSDETHAAFVDLPNYLGYDTFSAAYGNVYTARHLLQLLQRSLGLFAPSEDRWHINGRVIDPFRPGLRFPALDDAEFNLLRNQHLRAVRMVFETGSVFVFTLGLTEAWESKSDGAVFPACPGTIAGTFDRRKHRFHNFTLDEVRSDLFEFCELVRSINPTLRIVLTISPVPLVATATDQHVLLATTYSKSVLRAAAQEVTDSFSYVRYFPAYEIITVPQAPNSYYEADFREVSEEGVTAVMESLFGAKGDGVASEAATDTSSEESDRTSINAATLSSLIALAECDEVMVDRNATGQ